MSHFFDFESTKYMYHGMAARFTKDYDPFLFSVISSEKAKQKGTPEYYLARMVQHLGRMFEPDVTHSHQQIEQRNDEWLHGMIGDADTIAQMTDQYKREHASEFEDHKGRGRELMRMNEAAAEIKKFAQSVLDEPEVDTVISANSALEMSESQYINRSKTLKSAISDLDNSFSPKQKNDFAYAVMFCSKANVSILANGIPSGADIAVKDMMAAPNECNGIILGANEKIDLLNQEIRKLDNEIINEKSEKYAVKNEIDEKYKNDKDKLEEDYNNEISVQNKRLEEAKEEKKADKVEKLKTALLKNTDKMERLFYLSKYIGMDDPDLKLGLKSLDSWNSTSSFKELEGAVSKAQEIEKSLKDEAKAKNLEAEAKKVAARRKELEEEIAEVNNKIAEYKVALTPNFYGKLPSEKLLGGDKNAIKALKTLKDYQTPSAELQKQFNALRESAKDMAKEFLLANDKYFKESKLAGHEKEFNKGGNFFGIDKTRHELVCHDYLQALAEGKYNIPDDLDKMKDDMTEILREKESFKLFCNQTITCCARDKKDYELIEARRDAWTKLTDVLHKNLFEDRIFSQQQANEEVFKSDFNIAVVPAIKAAMIPELQKKGNLESELAFLNTSTAEKNYQFNKDKQEYMKIVQEVGGMKAQYFQEINTARIDEAKIVKAENEITRLTAERDAKLKELEAAHEKDLKDAGISQDKISKDRREKLKTLNTNRDSMINGRDVAKSLKNKLTAIKEAKSNLVTTDKYMKECAQYCQTAYDGEKDRVNSQYLGVVRRMEERSAVLLDQLKHTNKWWWGDNTEYTQMVAALETFHNNIHDKPDNARSFDEINNITQDALKKVNDYLTAKGALDRVPSSTCGRQRQDCAVQLRALFIHSLNTMQNVAGSVSFIEKPKTITILPQTEVEATIFHLPVPEQLKKEPVKQPVKEAGGPIAGK